jgi:hypothetical protein
MAEQEFIRRRRPAKAKLIKKGGTVPELFFEKKQLIPALQPLLLSYPRATS